MTKKFETILNSIGSWPPVFRVDNSPFRNCYAHALDCWYEDTNYEVYMPGIISAISNGSDVLLDDDFFDADLFIRLIKRDVSCLNGHASSCDFSSKTDENSYKIAVTYSAKEDDFHFIRQNANGSWSHKPGMGFKLDIITHRLTPYGAISSIIPYHGEAKIDIQGTTFKVIDILKLQKK